ncbi:hypothetical protein NUW58_g9343 [Xylaria curta]|uniref:Uncharacterized protein n=1 Tax=Xylaria curta TaxID=42375 RepID=A0ACC1MY63_9PEZI|nr:hypothetical protein NUW58_g9343 [Xylaria curta]
MSSPLAMMTAKAAVRGAPLTHKHTIPLASARVPKRINEFTITRRNIRSRASLTTGSRLFSTCVPARRDVTPNTSKNESSLHSKPGNQQPSPPSEEDFKVSFHNLGMNRVTKFVVYTVIGILGTMETIFWCKVLVSARIETDLAPMRVPPTLFEMNTVDFVYCSGDGGPAMKKEKNNEWMK